MRHRRAIAALVAVALLAVTALRHPTADIRVLTHQAGDPAPVRVQAAIDLGLMGINILVTWSHRLAR